MKCFTLTVATKVSYSYVKESEVKIHSVQSNQLQNKTKKNKQKKGGGGSIAFDILRKILQVLAGKNLSLYAHIIQVGGN